MSGLSKSGIPYLTHVWNPVVGCTKCSEACQNCYAKRLHDQRHLKRKYDLEHYGDTNMPRCYDKPFSEVRCLDKRLEQPLKRRKPAVIGVCFMSDLFHPDVPDWFIDMVFAVMAMRPQHVFVVLTKRPERMRKYLSYPRRPAIVCNAAMRRCNIDGIAGGWWPLFNVLVGVTVWDQDSADRAVPLLLDTPAALRWVSYEPMLGPVDLNRILSDSAREPSKTCGTPWGHSISALYGTISDLPGGPSRGRVEYDKLDWVICGGESGPWARPMHPDWARGLRDQCVSAGVPYYFKQWGAWAPGTGEPGRFVYSLDGIHNRAWSDKNCHDFGQGYVAIRVGKKAAGRVLDGRAWDEMPEVLEYKPEEGS